MRAIRERLRRHPSVGFALRWMLPALLVPELAWADLPESINSLVTAVVSGVFPIFCLYEAAKAGLLYARHAPEAKEKAEHVAIGSLVVLGINGVWSYLRSHVR